MSRSKANKEMYWAVMFDLSCEKLREIHPSHNECFLVLFCKNVKRYLGRSNNPAPDGDLDGFREVETPKQATVILFVLPSALGLTSRKTQEILGNNVVCCKNAGCDMDYINMHSEDYDPSTQKEEELDIVEEEVKRKQTLKEALMGRVLKRKEVIEKEQKNETSEWKLIL